QPRPFIRHTLLRLSHLMCCFEKEEVAFLRFYSEQTLNSVFRTDVLRTITENACNWQNLRKYFCAPQRLTLYIGDYICKDFCCLQTQCKEAFSLLTTLAERQD